MNLTKELIRRLEEKAATVRPSQRMDGSFPEDSAFLFPKVPCKGFIFQRTTSNHKYSFTLTEEKPDLEYTYCHARGFISGIEEITQLITEWCDQNQSVRELKSKYPELESFKPFPTKHEDEKIEKAWIKVKNTTFNAIDFWRRLDWLTLNDRILEKARQMTQFQKYIPFTSHDCLRFSLDEDLKDSWPLSLMIQPSHDFTKGKYLVTYTEKSDELYKYFIDESEALQFLSQKMEA